MNNSQLIEEINEIYTRIHDAYIDIERLKRELHEKQHKLYGICEHDWICDNSIRSEHTEYICRKCNLYKS